MTPRQVDEECFVNLFKSVHGYKPMHIRMGYWTDLQLSHEILKLAGLAEKNREEEDIELRARLMEKSYLHRTGEKSYD